MQHDVGRREYAEIGRVGDEQLVALQPHRAGHRPWASRNCRRRQPAPWPSGRRLELSASPANEPSACSADGQVGAVEIEAAVAQLEVAGELGCAEPAAHRDLAVEVPGRAIDLRHEQRQDLDDLGAADDLSAHRRFEQVFIDGRRTPPRAGSSSRPPRGSFPRASRGLDVEVDAAAAELDALGAELVARHVEGRLVHEHRAATDPGLPGLLLRPAARLQPPVELAPAEHVRSSRLSGQSCRL